MPIMQKHLRSKESTAAKLGELKHTTPCAVQTQTVQDCDYEEHTRKGLQIRH